MALIVAASPAAMAVLRDSFLLRLALLPRAIVLFLKLVVPLVLASAIAGRLDRDRLHRAFNSVITVGRFERGQLSVQRMSSDVVGRM